MVFLAFLASALSVFANQGPAEAAVEFVKKLGTGHVDLAPETDTAIMSEISPAKKEAILQRLQRLAVELNMEQIEVGPTRVEGSLAGVIVRSVNPADPMAVRLLSLAMVRKGETWRAAPVPASFENTVAAYSPSSRATAGRLELWLAREQAHEVERLRKSAGIMLRTSLTKIISPETIRTWTAEKTVSEFLEACAKREIPRMLALLGGVSDPLPEDWQQISNLVRATVASPSTDSNTLSLLTSPAVLRVADGDSAPSEKEACFQVLFLDPRNDEESFMMSQSLSARRSEDGLWKIEIPESEPVSFRGEESLKNSATLLRDRYPLRPQSCAIELKNSLLSCFHTPDSSYSCLEFIHRENHPTADLRRFKQAVRARWECLNPVKPVVPVELGFQHEADHAFLAIQWLSFSKLVYAPRVFHLQKKKEGWVWNSLPDKTAITAAEIWIKKNENAWKNSCLSLSVSSCAQPDFTLSAPGESEASALVQEWLEALAASNWHKALSLCAQLGTEKSPALLLRNLGYECKAIQFGSRFPPPETMQQGKFVALVATRSANETQSIQSLLPVVSTTAGPRILMEIDLGDPSRPGRAFLNRNSLDRLSIVQSKVAEELKGMISKQLGEGDQ